MTESPVQLKVLTYNLWGIFNSKMRQERMAHFASKIEHYDIILLQEQFDADDFARMQELLPPSIRKTRYFERFPSGFYGSGCAVISKYPITGTFFHIYPLQGYPEMILHGDFFANKGVALVKVDVPIHREGAIVNQEVYLYTTHLVAVYQKVSQMPSWRNERYLPYRISQAMSLASFIMNTSRPTDYVIIGGDFNSSQRSLEVQTMLIMLKRRGYDLRSVLPTPSALLSNPAQDQADLARSMFTYSYRNAFNASKTSYFKLLKLEADIPSQIDHIFFNAAAFTLRPFGDCPDIDTNFPTTVDVAGDGNKVPTGVVVFTEHEVIAPPTVSFRESLATSLRECCGGKGRHVWLCKALADMLAPPVKEGVQSTASGEPAEPEPPAKFPISDHFGVACRLEVHPRIRTSADGAPSGGSEEEEWHHMSSTNLAGARPAGAAGVGAPLLLSDDERLVVANVGEFLTGFVGKLRHQIKVTRVMAGISIAILGLNMWALRRLAQAQERRAAVVLAQLYQQTAAKKGGAAAAGKAAAKDAESTFTEDVVDIAKKSYHATMLVSGKAMRALGLSSDDGAKGVKSAATAGGVRAGEAEVAEPIPDFIALSREICLRPMWASVGASTALTMAASIASVGAFAVGMFQRQGNANILEHQIKEMEPLLLQRQADSAAGAK